jgi:hypothetical protein
MAGGVSSGPTAEPRYMRYQRAIELPAHAKGQACAELDANALGHAASRFGNDLRLFSGREAADEVPFALTESETQPDDGRSATVENAAMRDGAVVFDLRMPGRPYSDVVLDLAAKDFVGTAVVTGQKSLGAEAVPMGSFSVFDLSAQHLARSTTLSLGESTFPLLHVVLRLRTPAGTEMAGLGPGVVRGAAVPPSREMQTLYTTVAVTKEIEVKGKQSVAVLRIPAHVPVERITFALDPAFRGNFLRQVEITARPDGASDGAATESIGGSISSETLPGDLSGANRRLVIDAALGANLRESATVEIDVENGNEPPLPIRAISLGMRQRMICFDAEPSAGSYTLRYGDATLPAPVYDYARQFQMAAEPVMGILAPERANADWAVRPDERSFSDRHPELLWVGLLIAISVVGGTAAESVKKRKHHHH